MSKTINNWLEDASAELLIAGVQTARLDCLVLISDALKLDKSQILARPKQPIKDNILLKLNMQIQRRKKHEPLAYIRGKAEFYNRTFSVNKHTLQPRPETETMIDLLKQLTNSQKPPLKKDGPFTEKENVNWVVLDVGTGSGAIGISVGAEFPRWEVIGTDISEECIKIALKNAEALGAKVRFYCGDLLEPIRNLGITDKNTIIMTNLPYVPNDFDINLAAGFEPRLAIFGGDDGLDLYREFFTQLTKFSFMPAMIFTESLPFQHESLKSIASLAGYSIFENSDFIQVFTPTT